MIRWIVLLSSFALVWLIQWTRQRRYLRSLRDSSRCVACNADDLAMLAPAVYRCNACGYEGGEGRAARARALREASFRSMDPQERRESARRDLDGARMLASSGIGDLLRANAMVGEVLFDDHRVGSTARDHAKASGTGQLLQARSKLRDAATKLGLTIRRPGVAELPYRSTPEPAVLDATDDELRELAAVVRRVTEDDDAELGPTHGRAMLAAISRLAAAAGDSPRCAATG
jgi:hypothetical protein